MSRSCPSNWHIPRPGTAGPFLRTTVLNLKKLVFVVLLALQGALIAVIASIKADRGLR